MSKITGTVKWFNNKKGFGFISPTSDNSPTQEEIFVHQTSIFSDGAYRTLVEGAEVEFEVDKEQESGKWKAIQVTAPGGGSLKPPPRERRTGPRRPRNNGESETQQEEEGDNDKENGDKPEARGQRSGGRNRGRPPMKKASEDENATPATTTPAPRRDPPFHDVISEEKKEKIKEAGLELGNKGTVDVSLGDARIKLGQGGYAACALANGTIGEGTFTCDANGIVTFAWERCLSYVDDEWKPAETSVLLATLVLDTEGISSVKADETAESLWGAGKKDPKDAFEQNGFKMRRVVLARPPGAGRGRRPWNNKKK